MEKPHVSGTVTDIRNYKALVIPNDIENAPPVLQLGCWVAQKNLQKGDEVTLVYQTSGTSGQWVVA